MSSILGSYSSFGFMQLSHILVRATNWVGDAVLTIPALRKLREEFPTARISILAKPWVAGLYSREPFCDELIPYEVPSGTSGLFSRWQLAQTLKSRDFDCAVILPNSFDSALAPFLARIPRRIGYARDRRSFLLTDAVLEPKPGEIPQHERFRYLELLLRGNFIQEYDSSAPIKLLGAVDAAKEGRERLGKSGAFRSVIGVCPGAAYGSAKRWLPERFAEAGARVAGELDADVAIFGSKEEIPVCNTVEALLGRLGARCFNFAGQTTIGEFVELAAACELFLTNDSGPMHIASALGVPTVTVFGPTDEYATGPSGEGSTVVRVPVECSPCLLRECPIDHRCMTRVDSNLVASAALRLAGVRRE